MMMTTVKSESLTEAVWLLRFFVHCLPHYDYAASLGGWNLWVAYAGQAKHPYQKKSEKSLTS